MGWEDWNVALVQPGKTHSDLRSLLMKGMSTAVIPEYDAMIERILKTQVLNLLVNSDGDPRDIIEEYVALDHSGEAFLMMLSNRSRVRIQSLKH